MASTLAQITDGAIRRSPCAHPGFVRLRCRHPARNRLPRDFIR